MMFSVLTKYVLPLILRMVFMQTSRYVPIALTEAAERFRELQAEKEMKQLQEDRKNDKKPPPYKHIRVSCVITYSIYAFLPR